MIPPLTFMMNPIINLMSKFYKYEKKKIIFSTSKIPKNYTPNRTIFVRSSENLCISLESRGVGSMRRSKDSVHVNHNKGQRVNIQTYITNKVHTLLPNLAGMWPIHGIGSALSWIFDPSVGAEFCHICQTFVLQKLVPKI